jgi:hypothetical protein
MSAPEPIPYVRPHPWDALPPPRFGGDGEVTLGIDERIDELEQQLTDAMYAVEDAQDAVRDVEHALEALRDATKPRKAAAA